MRRKNLIIISVTVMTSLVIGLAICGMVIIKEADNTIDDASDPNSICRIGIIILTSIAYLTTSTLLMMIRKIRRRRH